MTTNELLDQAIELINQAKGLGTRLEADGVRKRNPVLAEDHPCQTKEAGVARIYWVGCNGLANLSRALGTDQRVDKIGISTELRLEDRLAILGRDRYGALQRVADGSVVEHSGFDRWIAQAVHVTREPRHPAIRITARTLDVNIPDGMTRRQLDAGLRRGLSPYAADRRGIERYTLYSGVDRVSLATELVVGLDPRRDGDRLLTIVEAVLEAHTAGTLRAHPDLPSFNGRPASVVKKGRRDRYRFIVEAAAIATNGKSEDKPRREDGEENSNS